MATVQALRKAGADEPLTVVSVERGSRFQDEDFRLTRALGTEIVGTLEPPRSASGSFPGWLLAFAAAELWLLLFRIGGPRSLRIFPSGPRRFFSAFLRAEASSPRAVRTFTRTEAFDKTSTSCDALSAPRRPRHSSAPDAAWSLPRALLLRARARRGGRVLSRARFVYLREERSYAIALDELGLRPNAIAVVPDVAFSLRVPAASQGDREAVGVTVRDLPFWDSQNPERSRVVYRTAIVRALRDLLDRGVEQVVFVPQAVGDIPFAQSLADELGEPDRVVALDSDLSLDELLGLYGRLRFVIATRLHSVILAAVAGTPAVHIAYELQKGLGIMEMLGMSRWVIPAAELTETNLSVLVVDFEQELEGVSRQLASRLEELRAELDELFEALPGSLE